MGRKSMYANAAERQKAYRARVETRSVELALTESRRNPKKRGVSRPKRLAGIRQAVETLLTEYQCWRGRLPEALAENEQAEALDETIDLLEQAVDLLAQVQPPLGYGRT